MTHADASGAPLGTPNRLALEKSPYLLQHARNPVDWHAWNPETLAKAKELDRPIFLSIGYATCHWCHVMERESFEDPATAEVMNASFLNIKVDREERPDVDQIYMATLLAMHGQGGWPLSVWLTPDLKPFYAGTYFPREPRWGRPGFPDLCRTLADIFKKRRADVEAQAAQAVTWLHRKAASGAGAKDLGDFPAAAVRALLGDFDAAHGGFGDAPKFPRPVTLELLARVVARGDAPEARRAAEATLDAMRRGGIYDHVGGGFARYATDARWLVPHFEKMLYDNAQLIDAYVDGALLLGRADFMAVAEDVARWVAREMTSPEGAFYSAQDADSEGEEGRFYVFTLDDLAAALGSDADEAARLFGATALGNFEGANVLSLPADASPEDLEASRPRREALRERLFAWRERRERPLLDDKILAAWNGLMIGALAGLGAATGDRRHVDAAERALRCVRDRLWDADARRLLRRYRDGEARFEASCDDYAAVALGALRVFSATGTAAWLAFARDLARRAEELFLDREAGGYFFAAASPDLVARLKEAYDGAFPSANALMALLHARLGAALEDEAERAKGRAVLRAVAEDLARAPHGSPLLAAVALELAEPPRRLLVAGRSDDAAFRALLRDAHRARLPGRVVVPVLDAERPALAALGLALATAPAAGSAPSAVLCEDLSCRPFPEPRRAQ